MKVIRSHKSWPNWSRFVSSLLPVLACFGVTALVVSVFLRTVDLKPKVEETFFFSKSDPQLRADNQIVKTFPDPPQIILAAIGDIQSPAYLERVQALSDALASLPGVVDVESLSRGPKNIDDAQKSLLWTHVLIANNRKSSYIIVTLKNNAGEGNHWLGVKLQGTSCNRDAVGATISWSANGTKRSRYKSNGGSYLSSHDMREVLGMGSAVKLDWLEIKWPPPSGRVERFTDLPVNRYVTIVEGKGRIEL